MSGKSTATSSISIGAAVLQTNTTASRHARSDPAVSGMKDNRQLRSGYHFVKRIRDAIIRAKFLQRRVQFEAPDPGGDQSLRARDRIGAARRVHAGKGDHHVGVGFSQSQDFFVGDLFTAGHALVDGEHDAPDLARPVIVCEFLPAEHRPRFTEILARRLVGGRIPGIRLDVNVRVDRDQTVNLHSNPPLGFRQSMSNYGVHE